MSGRDHVCGNCGREPGGTLPDPAGMAEQPMIVCDDCLSELGISSASARYSGIPPAPAPHDFIGRDDRSRRR